MISLLLGYLIFGLVLFGIVVLLTGLYIWRSRSIARKWWKRAEQSNDSGSKEPK